MTNADPSLYTATAATAVDLGFDDQLAKHRLESDNNDDHGGVQAISEADFIARIASFERRERQEAQRARRMMRRWTEAESTTTTNQVEFTQWQPPKEDLDEDQPRTDTFEQWIPPATYDQWIPPPSPVESTFSDATDTEVDYFPEPSSDIDSEEDEWVPNGNALPHLVYDPRIGYSLLDHHEEHSLDEEGLLMETLTVYPLDDLYPMHSMDAVHDPIAYTLDTQRPPAFILADDDDDEQLGSRSRFGSRPHLEPIHPPRSTSTYRHPPRVHSATRR